MYEGPDPERLLIEAWSRHGTSVRISEPTCVRKGGIFGFFAKLHYRIEVQPLEAAEQATTSPDGARAGAAAGEAPRPPAPGGHGEQHARPARSPGATAGALERLVESTEDLLELDSSPRRSFDDVLSEVASSLGDDPGHLRLPPLEPSGPAPLAVSAPPRTAGSETPSSAPIPPPTAPRDGLGRDRHGLADHRQGPGAARLLEQLAVLGCPPEVLARAEAAGGGREALEAAFAALPAPPALPTAPGSLLAVVGELGQALAVAGSLVDQLGLEDLEVALATPLPPAFSVPDHLLATEPARARALAPGWRRDATSVVAVACGRGPATPGWARRMLRALQPTATFAIASAAAKPEDVARRAEALGGVDALVLTDLDQTATPLTACAAGVPVARLGRIPASPEAWADVVDDLLAPPTAGRPGRVRQEQQGGRERSPVRCLG